MGEYNPLVQQIRIELKMEKNSEELLWAIKNGELNIVKDVVEKQVRHIWLDSTVDIVDLFRYLFVKLFHTQNFDVNYEIASRYPLHYAADYGQTDVLDYLLSKGADVNVCITCISSKIMFFC